MPIILDPITRQRILIDDFTTDVIYNKRSPDTAISQESVLILGPWKDFTGSKLAITSRTMLSMPRSANLLQGTDPGIEGEKLPNLNEVGQDTTKVRRRTMKVYVDLGKGKSNIAKT
jgi:hypothetical protein